MTTDNSVGNRPSQKQGRLERCYSDRSHDLLIFFLNWCFRTTLLRYIIVALIQFFMLNLFFAVIYFVYSEYLDKECVYAESPISGDNFAVAFTLSWTTFSTVGYGNTYPIKKAGCAMLTIFASLEAMVGVLFFGFCSTIIFAKVINIYAKAMVTFSDLFVIRYGSGVADSSEGDDDFQAGESTILGRLGVDLNDDETDPFPILVFRIVNDLANSSGGDGSIMDMCLQATAVIDSDKKIDGALPKKKFLELLIAPSNVPLFERVVYVRHVLNYESPLLSKRLKSDIRLNGNKWPSDYNSPTSIKNHLKFESIMITLEGISNISKSSVTSHRSYVPDDGKIGWQFVGMTYKHPERGIQVELPRLNRLMEQEGGGSERIESSVFMDFDTTRRDSQLSG